MKCSIGIRLVPRLLLSCLVCLVGCEGSGRASVTGKVTLDGQPLELGVITFQPEEGTASPSSGGDIVNGSYEVFRAGGPMAGTFRVEVNALRKTGRQIPAGSPAPPGTMVDEYVEAIPAQYNRQTILRAEIRQGKNVHDFAVTSQ